MISKGFAGLPPHGRGQRVGLFGGSFNPPHDGHRTASLLALHRLQLDWVWWLVSPGNPLKDHNGLPPIAERLAVAQAVAAHPRIVVTAFEQELGSPFTWHTVAALRSRCPSVRFVWLMGADSFADLYRWSHWRRIAATLPLAIVDRPGSTFRAAQARAAIALDRFRRGETAASRLADQRPPAYVFLHGRRSDASSTILRAGRPTGTSTTSPSA